MEFQFLLEYSWKLIFGPKYSKDTDIKQETYVHSKWYSIWTWKFKPVPQPQHHCLWFRNNVVLPLSLQYQSYYKKCTLLTRNFHNATSITYYFIYKYLWCIQLRNTAPHWHFFSSWNVCQIIVKAIPMTKL